MPKKVLKQFSDVVVVLGAGATRGAKFVEPEGGSCLPFLNQDFFTQLQRIHEKKHDELVKSVIKDVVKFFGNNFSLGMEEYFTQITLFRDALKLKGYLRDLLKADDLKLAERNLINAICAVLEGSTYKAVANKKSEGCLFHSALVDSLCEDATIISFNYDVLVDHALRRSTQKRWNPNYGYCFPHDGGYKIEGAEHWIRSSEELVDVTSKNTIKLLKLHGSLNWKVDANKKRIILKQRMHQQRGNPQFTIIPPTMNKGSLLNEDVVFNRIWHEAAQRLGRAKSLIVIGYSFGVTDLHASALFRMAIKRGSLDRLIIVNPIREARLRARTVLAHSLSNKTVIAQFESLKDYSGSLSSSPNSH